MIHVCKQVLISILYYYTNKEDQFKHSDIYLLIDLYSRTWSKLLLSINLGSNSKFSRLLLSSWQGGNVGECCGDKEDEEDDMDDGGGVVVVAEAAVEHLVKIPIFDRDDRIFDH